MVAAERAAAPDAERMTSPATEASVKWSFWVLTLNCEAAWLSVRLPAKALITIFAPSPPALSVMMLLVLKAPTEST